MVDKKETKEEFVLNEGQKQTLQDAGFDPSQKECLYVAEDLIDAIAAEKSRTGPKAATVIAKGLAAYQKDDPNKCLEGKIDDKMQKAIDHYNANDASTRENMDARWKMGQELAEILHPAPQSLPNNNPDKSKAL